MDLQPQWISNYNGSLDLQHASTAAPMQISQPSQSPWPGLLVICPGAQTSRFTAGCMPWRRIPVPLAGQTAPTPLPALGQPRHRRLTLALHFWIFPFAQLARLALGLLSHFLGRHRGNFFGHPPLSASQLSPRPLIRPCAVAPSAKCRRVARNVCRRATH